MNWSADALRVTLVAIVIALALGSTAYYFWPRVNALRSPVVSARVLRRVEIGRYSILYAGGYLLVLRGEEPDDRGWRVYRPVLTIGRTL